MVCVFCGCYISGVLKILYDLAVWLFFHLAQTEQSRVIDISGDFGARPRMKSRSIAAKSNTGRTQHSHASDVAVMHSEAAPLIESTKADIRTIEL